METDEESSITILSAEVVKALRVGLREHFEKTGRRVTLCRVVWSETEPQLFTFFAPPAEKKPCPFCGTLRLKVSTVCGGFFVNCLTGNDACSNGPIGATRDAAIAAWNNRRTL